MSHKKYLGKYEVDDIIKSIISKGPKIINRFIVDDAINLLASEYGDKIYKHTRYTEKSKSSSCEHTRIEAYKALGFTEEAFTDDCPLIRLEAFIKLGWRRIALSDPDIYIRGLAKDYYGIKQRLIRFITKIRVNRK